MLSIYNIRPIRSFKNTAYMNRRYVTRYKHRLSLQKLNTSKSRSFHQVSNHRIIRTQSFAADVLLHQLSYQDIFWLSVSKNLILFQLPCIFMYTLMNFSNKQIVYYLYFNAILKTCIELIMYLQSN